MAKNFDDMYHRFDTTPALVRRQSSRISIARQNTRRLAIANRSRVSICTL